MTSFSVVWCVVPKETVKYGGHVPTLHYRFGKSFGSASREVLEDPCVSQGPIPVLERPYSARNDGYNNNHNLNYYFNHHRHHQQESSFNLQQQQKPPSQRPQTSTSKSHRHGQFNLPPQLEPDKLLDRPKTCCCYHNYLLNNNKTEPEEQGGPHFEFIFPASASILSPSPSSSSASPPRAHYSVSCDYRPKTNNSGSQTGADDSKNNDKINSSSLNVSKKSKRCASVKSSTSSIRHNNRGTSTFCSKENLNSRRQLVDDDCPKINSTRKAPSSGDKDKSHVAPSPQLSCPAEQGRGHDHDPQKYDGPSPSPCPWHQHLESPRQVVGCSDLGCCPPISCRVSLPPKNENFDCSRPSCCFPEVVKKCDPKTIQTQSPRNRSPYAAQCRTEPNQDIYRHCEPLASGYSGHVPGLTFYNYGRTYGKATCETKKFMDNCMMFNLSAKK